MKTHSLPAQPQPATPPVQPVQIADLVLEEVIDREKDHLLFTGSPRQYRADCQMGQFKIGAARMMGGALEMELIAARIIEGELFGYPLQRWLNLIFVDPDGVVSTALFKTESMDNLLELHRQAAATGDILLGKVIQARMSRRAARASGQGYYAVEFEITGPGKYADAITQFRQETVIDNIYRVLPEPHAHVDADAA